MKRGKCGDDLRHQKSSKQSSSHRLHLDPKEIEKFFGKLGDFPLSAEAIYDIRTNEGMAIHDWVLTEAGLQARLQALECPQSAGAFVVGLDGVNLALREAGIKWGRPAERPIPEGEGIAPKQSCYKNAIRHSG